MSKNHRIEKNSEKSFLREKIDIFLKIFYDKDKKSFISKEIKIELFSLFIVQKKLGFFNLDISDILNNEIMCINNRIKIENRKKNIFLEFFLRIFLLKKNEKKHLNYLPKFLFEKNIEKKNYSEFVKDLLIKKQKQNLSLLILKFFI